MKAWLSLLRTQESSFGITENSWIPAFAGMTTIHYLNQANITIRVKC